MKRTKLTISAIVIILTLFFTITAVEADMHPTVGSVNKLELEMPGLREFTIRHHFLTQLKEEPITVSGDPPQPLTPSMVYVYDKTPKFLFSCNSEAEKYKIVVNDTFTDAAVYTFKGSGVCSETAGCCLEPTTPLKYSNLSRNPYQGYAYTWAVKAKIGDFWQNVWSTSSEEFWVISPGFESTFDIDMNKWQEVNGTWAFTDAGYLKSAGDAGKWASVVRSEFFVDFDYSVKMKRKTSAASSNALIVWGNSSPLTNYKEWDDGIYFAYNNSGQYATWYLFNGTKTMIQPWTDVPDYIDEFGWNTLRVVADMPILSFYINDHYLGYAKYIVDFPYDIMDGWVGIGIEKQDNGIKEPLMVDWATLTSFQDKD